MNIEEVERVAKKCMEENGSHTAQIMLDTGNAYEIMLLCFRDDEEKTKMRETIRMLINARNISSYFFITEGWIAGNPNLRPSKDPNRKEGLIIQEFNRNLKNKSVINVFARVNDKIKWVKRDFREGTGEDEFSSWNFFVEDASEERMKKVRIDYFLANIDKKKFDADMELATKRARKDLKNEAITREQIERVFLKMVGKGMIQKGEHDGYGRT